MTNVNDTNNFAELNAAVDILIAIIALDKNIDQTEIEQFKFELNNAHFSGQNELKAAAISYVENSLANSLDAFNYQYVLQRAKLVKSPELQTTVVMAALAISHADNYYHDNERTAVKALRKEWGV